MSEKAEKVAVEDMLKLAQQKARAAVCLATAEKSASDYKLAEAEYKNILTGIYFKYGLTQNDKIDEESGTIIYATPVENIEDKKEKDDQG